ncbi:hypothetical protein ACPPTR_08915 [Ralstonia pseudosolanacearum]|uniref:hypothetical protein n=1 Tax=Ralstonia pseudosolanacearum TaxID=1310165 RepID=UPI000B92E2EA|nr:hypothetical protein [Ralstonia pseudosolanacearum]MCD9228610.1 hypothetical protein [Ralstonia pseudosolanacearum]
MKVVLKETVYDRIKQKLYAAQYQRRTVDYIVVTPDEMRELMNDPRSYNSVERRSSTYWNNPHVAPSEPAFRTMTFTSRRVCGGTYTVYSDYTFRGIDIFTVAEEYHPQ